ncbi:glycosyltransferase [Bacillus sp. CMF12]|uniref:CgeB family protein n=1 Tax=Bacillaceae TaxID=186817 RepID=UPI001FB431E1|nr:MULTISPECIES: glycosyltransferase [Bacillaceae]UOE53082.1 glycosyltransferase [Cytobacillus oceanisediminis]USK52290.1 glycosyltransferase [Bacillus sp. CMF12]
MRILFITSGYKGIYDWFESWIQDELIKEHKVFFYYFSQGVKELESILQTFKPELALTLVGYKIPKIMLEILKQYEIKTSIWLTEDPYNMDRSIGLMKDFDYLFTIDTSALEYYKKIGHKKAFHLPLAANPDVFQPKKVAEEFKSDICFVGYPYPDRIQLLEFILQRTTYKVSVIGFWSRYLRSYWKNNNLIINEGWAEPPTVANYYNGAKIVLNSHRPLNLRQNKNKLGIAAKSINNRTFDVAACGAFQLIEFREDLTKHFIENEEMVAFRNIDDLIQKIHYYIKADTERKAIANKARNRVLKDHTFQHRIEQMLSIIRKS